MPGLVGHISQIIGPVVDVHFDLSDDSHGQLPSIHEALTIARSDSRELIVEVQQHIGEDTVRTVAMDSTDGLKRGMIAVCTGAPITMPVGAQIRGRVMNVVGDTIDGMKERTILINGFSKAHAMTGWRLGYLCAPAPLLKEMLKLHQYAIMCSPTTSQLAAIEALRNGDDDVKMMVEEYNRRRRLIHKGLRDIGIECFEPQGAFYIYPYIWDVI